MADLVSRNREYRKVTKQFFLAVPAVQSLVVSLILPDTEAFFRNL